MLDRTHYPAPVAPSISTVSGQTIAKSDWGPRQRADLAARWKLGMTSGRSNHEVGGHGIRRVRTARQRGDRRPRGARR